MDTQTTAPSKLDKRIDQYVRLRDKIREITDRQKNELRPYKETLEKLNGIILSELEASGSESVRTATGTAFKVKHKSATIADRAVFWQWLYENEAWEAIDYKANATVIYDYLQQGLPLPPGLNYVETWEANIRRPTTKKQD